MPKKILSEQIGKKLILLGNEAIVRGALESGVQFASTYPGTPASEIGDTFAEIANDAGIYFEYSTNEKVALEAAAGAALSGLRSMVSFKHYGLNVASDSIFPMAYIGVKGGMVIAVADDPNCWSSVQSEQDSRYYARLMHIPMLEPSNPQECKDYTKIAFDLSEKFQIPVFLRTTTRVSNMKGVVKLGKIIKGERVGKFIKSDAKFRTFPPKVMEVHKELHEKLGRIAKIFERSKMNFTVNEYIKSDCGVIASGVSFDYVMDALDDLKIKVPVLKLGVSYPLPEKKIRDFIKKFKSVLVVEELDPVIEDSVRAIAKDVNPKLKIFGKNYLPTSGEFTEEVVISAVSKLTGKKLGMDLVAHKNRYKKIKMARRFPLMCPGCPHRATFYAVKMAMGDAVFGGDIGCYLLGVFPPLDTTDFLISMGAGEGIIHGIKKATNQKSVAFIGDSTFFHAGIPALINMVFNKSNPIVIVLDNRATAMTGHQPHPGVGITGMGEQTKAVSISDIAKACGVEDVKVVDPFNVKEMVDTVKEFSQKDKVSVIVARRMCQLLAIRQMKKANIQIPRYGIDQSKCSKCGVCLHELACPAVITENGEFKIDEELCTGCGVCAQICPTNAIQLMKR
jgi:indolepyruvate ferredoxin oxidoreductase alpha subunit